MNKLGSNRLGSPSEIVRSQPAAVTSPTKKLDAAPGTQALDTWHGKKKPLKIGDMGPLPWAQTTSAAAAPVSTGVRSSAVGGRSVKTPSNPTGEL